MENEKPERKLEWRNTPTDLNSNARWGNVPGDRISKTFISSPETNETSYTEMEKKITKKTVTKNRKEENKKKFEE